MKWTIAIVLVSILAPFASPVPFIVQTLSSRYGLVLGGYGPGYKELREVEVVRHDKVCSNVINDVPSDNLRFLGAVSGMAEYVNGSVIYCRHKSCWQLNVIYNKWKKVGGFQVQRDRAASVSVGDQMIVMGGRANNGTELLGFEVYNEGTKSWKEVPEWRMAEGRYSFCAVPMNSTAILIIGGYNKAGALSTVELLDTKSGTWEKLTDLPQPRYGHSCLLMELAGQEGILVSGGALTGSDVDFYDLKERKWKSMPSLQYRTDGHKMVLVEGIPTVFSWQHIEQFDGQKWINAEIALSQSRSAFAVTTVPGHLVQGEC